MDETELFDSPSGTASSYAMDEDERLSVLEAMEPDSLVNDPELNSIARFAARLCNTPIALVTIIERDRQRFLAREGTSDREGTREGAFCAQAMMQDGIFQVCNAAEDQRYRNNPYVTGGARLRFYAGQPLVSDDRVPIGALCVIDTSARQRGLTELQREGLAVLARAVMRRISQHREDVQKRQEIERHEGLVWALADSMPAIVWSCDAAGNFDYFNHRLYEFTGVTECMTGETLHPDDLGPSTEKWMHSMKTGEPYETEHRMRRADGQYRWMMARAMPLIGLNGKPERWFGTAIDIHDLHEMAESRELLARELSHRIKNIFAVVSGLISLSSRRKPEHKEFGEELMATIRALGRAHDYVRPVGAGGSGHLLGVLEVLFAPYGTGEEARIHVHGDEVLIQPRAATPLALVFHELATNAAKYGALSTSSGHVDLSIRDAGENVELTWKEIGGPAVPEGVAASTEGFGSRLIEMSLTGQLCGSWKRHFEPEGLIVELTVSKQAIAP